LRLVLAAEPINWRPTSRRSIPSILAARARRPADPLAPAARRRQALISAIGGQVVVYSAGDVSIFPLEVHDANPQAKAATGTRARCATKFPWQAGV
jgi:hypothetical protein